MNLLLLPKELQDLVGEFNVEHRPKMKLVTNELFKKHHGTKMCVVIHELLENTELITDTLCFYCGNYADEYYTKNILWCEYTFCGDRCQYEAEKDVRKNYTKSYKNSV
jgi:hypothetical protein